MSRFEDPVIITNSISGRGGEPRTVSRHPLHARGVRRRGAPAVDEGASMIHIHARTPDGVPSYEIEDFQAITDAILGAVDDVIINYSTGAIGVPLEKRIEYLRALKPDIAALNMGSMNYAKYSKRRKDFVFKAVFENSFDTIIELVEAMNELGIRPEHECFDMGHIANLDPLIDMGMLLRAAADLVRDGRDRRHPAERAQPRAHGRADAGRARGPQQLGRDRRSRASSGSSSRRR